MVAKSFSGGEKLEAKLREIAEKLETGGAVRVGFLEGSTYPDGTSLPMVAATQEFGSSARGIPPRPFFRTMIAKHSANWGDAMGRVLVHTGYDAAKALELVGEGIKGELVQSITDTNDPPLAPATVARKGFDKPLVDTGHMRNSVGVEVVDE